MLGEGAGMDGVPGLGPGSLEQVVTELLAATKEGFDQASRDEGVVYTFFQIVRITQILQHAGGLDRCLYELRYSGVGQDLPEYLEGYSSNIADGVGELVADLVCTIDERLSETRTRTDFGAIAQKSAAQSLVVFGQGMGYQTADYRPESLEEVLRYTSTQSGFAELSREYFARLTSGFLVYHLSKELSNHVGPGRRFPSASEHNAFLRGIQTHCQTSAAVLEPFTNRWYQKNYAQDITRRRASSFVKQALKRIRDALLSGESRDAP